LRYYGLSHQLAEFELLYRSLTRTGRARRDVDIAPALEAS